MKSELSIFQYFATRFGLILVTALVSPVNAEDFSINTRQRGCLNFRSKPSINSNVYSCLPFGTTVNVLQNSGRGFALVEVNGKKGYVASRLITKGSKSRTGENLEETLVRTPKAKKDVDSPEPSSTPFPVKRPEPVARPPAEPEEPPAPVAKPGRQKPDDRAGSPDSQKIPPPKGPGLHEERGYVMNGRNMTAGIDLPDAQHSMRATCSKYVPRPTKNLCKNPDHYAKFYAAASVAMGVPAVALVCMTFAETNMGELLTTSTAGARGLTQFMPATARMYESLFKRKSEFQEGFEKYKSELTMPNLSFAASKLLTNQINDDDTPIQIYGSAMYFRDNLNNWGDLATQKLSSESGFYWLTRAIMAAYNGGPARGICYLRNQSCSLPRETQGYMPKIEKCIRNAVDSKPRMAGV